MLAVMFTDSSCPHCCWSFFAVPSSSVLVRAQEAERIAQTIREHMLRYLKVNAFCTDVPVPSFADGMCFAQLLRLGRCREDCAMLWRHIRCTFDSCSTFQCLAVLFDPDPNLGTCPDCALTPICSSYQSPLHIPQPAPTLYLTLSLRGLQAIILLQNNYRVDSSSQISLIAHVVDGREAVKLRGPEWGVSLPLPHSWAPDSKVLHGFQ